MYPEPEKLHTESDVEQKLILPLLTNPHPSGLAYTHADIVTKLSIRRLQIGKGTARKLYYPDYLVVMAGLPVLVIEAKAVGEPIESALDEARLYANEINALFPHQVNPCARVIACNGETLSTAPSDSSTPDLLLSHNQMSPANIDFAKFVDLCGRAAFQNHVDLIRARIRPQHFRRPVSLVGGTAFQGEELPQNTFGATIAGDYGHIFNPKTREDRARIVREAYIGSLRRQRYVEPIDRLVRNAVAPTAAKIKPLDDSATPIEITTALRDRKKLENQILLLIGSVGAGKSTFVDYLSLVALPAEIRDKTLWLRINLNEAPLSLDRAYDWITKAILEELRSSGTGVDFDDLETLEKIFRYELQALKKGPLAILDPNSVEYRVRIADRLTQLQSNPQAMAKGIANVLCSGPNRLLVIVLDNCDKRSRDEQLTMFQIAQWVQSEFRCLVVLPLRDVTFDLHRHDPPLDTALKQFVFRIEPPQFSDVLQARVRLALTEIARTSASASALSYLLPNGIKVTYPAEDQALYLASILRSLYAHDRFVRQVMTGLAGRDVRRALEIFLDFCMSGHIGEEEIFKIRLFQGQHVLPLSVVARVLLRSQRRFYDGNRSYLKNIVQCHPDDPLPDHFVRLALLHWFERKLRVKGPAGVEGFHRAADMIADLAAVGHEASRVREELAYLAREGCLVPEHLRTDRIEDFDLVKVTAAGVVHLQLMANPEYLAACAEDTWISDQDLCKRIAERIGAGFKSQFSPLNTARNAGELVEYLKAGRSKAFCAPEVFLESSMIGALGILREAEAGVAAAEVLLPERLYIGGLHYDTTEDELRDALSANNIAAKIITFPQENRRSRGFAFIEPSTKADVLAALEQDGAIVLRGRRLRINEAHPLDEEHVKSGGRVRSIPELSIHVYVGNVPYSCDATDVRALLSENDLTAANVFVLKDKKTGRSRGVCFVEFSSLDEAARAIGALNGVDFKGRRLVVHPADPHGKN
jgi:energy-coupling factor transporter ATP-binding protein EcfA2